MSEKKSYEALIHFYANILLYLDNQVEEIKKKLQEVTLKFQKCNKEVL